MFQKLLDQLERRIGRYSGIRNLMTYLVIAMAGVYVADLVLRPSLGFSLSSFLSFDRTAILRGQVWRLVTFVLCPPDSSILFIIVHLMFYFFLGNMLQSHWGVFRFNMYYLCGMLFSIIGGLITGYATNYYLNLSLLLAVAILYPDIQVNLYGILPIRMKWLAVLDLVMILPGLISGSWSVRAAIIVSLLNVVLFFYGRFISLYHDSRRRAQWRKNWR